MSRMRFDEKPEFRRGRGGEDVVAGFLARRGCHYIPSYAYTGTDGDKAPRLHGLWTGYVVPDFDAAREGTRFWVEVKTKTNPVLWRRTGELRHGISVRHLADYREVERITGTPCWLFIYELSTGWLLGRTLAGLGAYSPGTDRGEPMAYWPRSRFRQLEQILPASASS